MAITCPIELDTSRLRAEIQSIYARVADDPASDFHFHRGPGYAAERLQYDPQTLATLPPEATASFAGIANPHRVGNMPVGATVLDIGCGAGMDLLLASQRVGRNGRAIGVDMTATMVQKAQDAARKAGLSNVEVRLGDAMSLPVENDSIDIVISNGVLNLTPDKAIAYGEVFRVLKPGGHFFYGDIVVGMELSESVRRNVDLWTG